MRVDWNVVPTAVVSFMKLAAAPVAAVRAALPADGYRAAYWHADRDVVYVRDGCGSFDWGRIKAAKVVVAGDEPPPGLVDGDHPWVLVKRADPVVQAVAGAANLVPTPLNDLVGGATPLAGMLSGGALGALAGYGGGYLAESLFGPHVTRKGKLRKFLAAMGGVAGAAPGAWMWSISSRENPDASVWKTLVNPWPHTDEAIKAGQSAIPRNQFGQVVWADEQTPLPIRAATNGLLTAAGELRGGANLITPMDVAKVAIGMGSGYVSGVLVGKTLGALAGLTPDAQSAVRRSGTWAGVLTSVVPMAFGRA